MGKIKFKDKYDNFNNKWNSFFDKHLFMQFLPKNILVLILYLFFIIVCSLNVIKSSRNHVIYESKITNQVIEPVMIEPFGFNLNNIESVDNPSKICLKVATYDRKNSAHYRFIINDGENELSSTLFSAVDMKDNDFYCFKLENVDFTQKDKYSFSLKPVYADSYNTIGLYVDANTSEPVIRFVRNDGYLSFTTIMFLIIFIISLIINYFINRKNIDASKLWLLFIPYIIILTILIPPYEVPDEPTHFETVYNYTQANDNPNDSYVLAPSNVGCLGYASIELFDHVNDIEDVKECITQTDNQYVYFDTIGRGRPYGYTFALMGLKLGDLLTNSPFIIFYLGRLFNAIGSIIIIFFAIKIAPKYKKMILFCAILPMFLQQMISYSYDSILHSICLLYISVILNLLESDSNRHKVSFVILCLLSIFIFGIKMIYIPILSLLFIDKNNLKFTKKVLIFIGTIVLSYILFKVLDYFLGYGSSNLVSATAEAYSDTNVNNISLFELAWNTIQFKSWFYIESLIGYFGWFRYEFPLYIYIIYIILFGNLIISENNSSSLKSRIFPLLCVVFSIIGVFGAIYVGWSSSTLNYIDGVQGRYFLPLLLPFMILILPKKKILNISDKYFYNIFNALMLYYLTFILICYY